MVFETTGKFQLVVGDDDNYDKIMEAVGVPPEKRQKVRSLRPVCEYSHDGDQYKVAGSAEGFPERSKDFVLDVEQEETTMDGRKVKSTYKRNGKSMVQHEVQENGSTIVYEREIKGDDMHVKISYGNLVANRVFKRL
ncbi:fatty acid-binding protein, muscle-like isoform X1 [Daphnia pulex]|uniref:fatty acid-binding protein, muscle-like isoform X1 n=1 Tax=Daphnia pulex TaxID=6669 RepID=UPI001EDF7C01|nr:fatty acid-binding protein, muscle-like isoform X1 [Daphnia pulex]